MLSTNEPTALKVSENTLFTIFPSDKPTFIVIPQSWSIDDRKPVLPAHGDINGLWFGFRLFGFWLFGTWVFGFWLFGGGVVVGVWFGGGVAGFGFTVVVVPGTVGGAFVTAGVFGPSVWTGEGSENFRKLIEKLDQHVWDCTVP